MALTSLPVCHPVHIHHTRYASSGSPPKRRPLENAVNEGMGVGVWERGSVGAWGLWTLGGCGRREAVDAGTRGNH